MTAPSIISPTQSHVIRLTEDVHMVFRRIPAGVLRMGSRGYHHAEGPIHEVRIADDFWLGETPATQAQFGVWAWEEKVEHENHFKDCLDHPAESLDWANQEEEGLRQKS